MQLYNFQASWRVLLILLLGLVLGFFEQYPYGTFLPGFIIIYAWGFLMLSWILGVLLAILDNNTNEKYQQEYEQILDEKHKKRKSKYIALNYAIFTAIVIFVVRVYIFEFL